MTPNRSTLAVTLALAAALTGAFSGLGTAQEPAAAPAAPADTRLTIERIFSPDSSGHAPGQLTWSPEGRRLAYVYDDGAGEALWVLDAGTGSAEAVLRLPKAEDAKQEKQDEVKAAEKSAAGEKRPDAGKTVAAGDAAASPTALDALVWSPRGDSLLVLSKGDLYLLPLSSGQAPHPPHRLTATAAEESDPKFSPDGSGVAFVRDDDLHLLDLASGRERALTRGGEKDVTLQGTTDWVYWEEIWDREATGYWWSPDGRKIAYYRFDERPVGVYPLIDQAPADAAANPPLRNQKYPRPGEPNPRVQVGVLDLASGRTTWLATGGQEGGYLARVAWAADDHTVFVERLNRAQTRLDLLGCAPAGGACRVLASQQHPTWVNLGKDFRPLPDGRFVWGSEESGWRRLNLYGADGKLLRPLTPENWSLTSLDGVTAAGKVVATGFTAPASAVPHSLFDPARRQVIEVGIDDRDGGAVRVLAGEPGDNAALVAPATGDWVHTWSDGDHLPRSVVRRPGAPQDAPAGAAPEITLPRGPAAFDPAALPRWEFFTVAGPSGLTLPARMLKPAGFDPARRYPAIVYHYGGPGSQVVVDRWDSRGRDLWHKMMAQRGYAVFMVDNASSTFFGKVGEDRDHLRFGEGNLAAQLALVDQIKALGWVDPARIGLWGWSGGGSNTLYCVLHRPGVWRAAMAGAPVTDWRLYDSIWTERYLGDPKANAEGYRLSSPVTSAGELKDRLLLVHGLADDNVHPQNSIALAARWVEASLPFEQALYPGQKHAFGRESNRHFYARMTEFFERTLGENNSAAKP